MFGKETRNLNSTEHDVSKPGAYKWKVNELDLEDECLFYWY